MCAYRGEGYDCTDIQDVISKLPLSQISYNMFRMFLGCNININLLLCTVLRGGKPGRPSKAFLSYVFAQPSKS